MVTPVDIVCRKLVPELSKDIHHSKEEKESSTKAK
jgi:hypothetical protein